MLLQFFIGLISKGSYKKGGFNYVTLETIIILVMSYYCNIIWKCDVCSVYNGTYQETSIIKTIDFFGVDLRRLKFNFSPRSQKDGGGRGGG